MIVLSKSVLFLCAFPVLWMLIRLICQFKGVGMITYSWYDYIQQRYVHFGLNLTMLLCQNAWKMSAFMQA